VAFDTPDSRIFTPLDPPKLVGRAEDGYGVRTVHLDFYDVVGRSVGSITATCPECPGGIFVTWSASPRLLPGRYVVRAYALDLVGNKSATREIAIYVLTT
jgi:hypothetical protein